MTNEKLLGMLVDIAGTEEVRRNPELDLYGTQTLDSIRTVELIVLLEEECGVRISPAEFDRASWATPAKFLADVEARMSALA
ncbi:MAG TPA: D-alanine--poly(phosphoribitol) ligase subunit 2 [Verrucomicrobiaceae bacterium]